MAVAEETESLGMHNFLLFKAGVSHFRLLQTAVAGGRIVSRASIFYWFKKAKHHQYQRHLRL